MPENSRGTKKTTRIGRQLYAPLLVAALLRGSLAAAAYASTGTRAMTQGDTESYLEPGRSLILHGFFATGGQPEIDRTPGYPIFAMLGGMLWNNALLVVAAQILLSLLSLLVIYRIAQHVFPTLSIGVIAAWLYAFEPLSILYTARLMPETLFTLLLLIAIERVLAFHRYEKMAILATAGVSLAAATFVRPVSLYLGFALAIGVAATLKNRPGIRWKAPAVLLLSFAPLLLAWQIRNFIQTGYNGFSSVIEKNLYFYQSAEVTAELEGISLETEQRRLGYSSEADYLAAHPEQVGWSRSQRLRFMHDQASRILHEHASLYFRSHFAGVAVVAFTPCAAEWLQLLEAYPKTALPHRLLNEGILASILRVIRLDPEAAAVLAMLEAFLLLLYGLVLIGIWGGRGTTSGIVILAAVALYFPLISGGAQAVGRYRLPAMPIFCILGAAGIDVIREKMRSRHSSAFLKGKLS